jgi:hypothetical protein
MARTWRSAKGSQGTWHAEVKWNDGTTERLACVHQHFSKAGHYYDPLSPEFYDTPADEDPRFAEWLDLIRAKGRVIMTKSELVRGGGYSHARRLPASGRNNHLPTFHNVPFRECRAATMSNKPTYALRLLRCVEPLLALNVSASMSAKALLLEGKRTIRGR